MFEIPIGYRFTEPPFDKLPSLQSFTKSELEREILTIQRNFRLVGSPYVAPPGLPKDRAKILQRGFRNLYNDPELKKVWTKLTGEEVFPLSPEEQFAAIKSIPRDAEILSLYKKIAGPGPLPPR